jgi:hypothetical protein
LIVFVVGRGVVPEVEQRPVDFWKALEPDLHCRQTSRPLETSVCRGQC